MAASPNTELELAEAKQHLRKAADRLSLAGYVQDHPYRMLAIALSAGFIIGQSREGQEQLSRLMINTLLHGTLP